MRLVLLLALPLWGCDLPPPVLTEAPAVEAARPAGGARAGAPVTLLGQRFGLRGPQDRVTLGGADVTVESWDDRQLLLRLSRDTPAGVYPFVVRNGPLVSAPFDYEVLPPRDASDANSGFRDTDAGGLTP